MGRTSHLGPPKTLYVLIYAISLKQWALGIYIANNKPSQTFTTFVLQIEVTSKNA